LRRLFSGFHHLAGADWTVRGDVAARIDRLGRTDNFTGADGLATRRIILGHQQSPHSRALVKAPKDYQRQSARRPSGTSPRLKRSTLVPISIPLRDRVVFRSQTF